MFDENAHVILVIFSKAKSFKYKLSVRFFREVGHCVVLQCTSKRSLVVDVSKTVAKNSVLLEQLLCEMLCFMKWNSLGAQIWNAYNIYNAVTWYTCGGILFTCDDTKNHALFICTVYRESKNTLLLLSLPNQVWRLQDFCHHFFCWSTQKTIFNLVHLTLFCILFFQSFILINCLVTWYSAFDIFIIHRSTFDPF